MGVFCAHHLAATSGSIGFTNSGTSSRTVAAAIAFTEDTTTGAGGGGAPTVTTVNSTDIVTATQSGVVIVGTNFGATRSTSTVKTVDGANRYEVSAYTAWSDTSLTVTLAHTGSYLAKQIEVTVGGVTVSHNITINPPSPYTTVTSLGILAPLTFSDRNLPSRIYDVSPDIANNEQVRWYVSGGSGAASIENDGALQVVTGVLQVTYSHFNASTGWSADTVADCRGLFPDFIPPNILDETLPQNVAITTRAYGAKFEDLDGGTAAYSLVGGAIPGLSLDSTTGDYTGTPTTIGTYSNRKVRRTDNEGNTADSNAFAYVIGAPPVPPLKLSDITSDSFTVNVAISTKACGSSFSGGTSFALNLSLPTGLSFNTGTGDITGTPTVAGVYAGFVVTATNAAGSTASNPFSLTVISATPTAPVFVGLIPDIAQSTSATTMTLNVSGYFTGTVDSYVVSPDPPTGITFDPATAIFTIDLSVAEEWAGAVSALNINGSDTSNNFGIFIGVGAVPQNMLRTAFINDLTAVPASASFVSGHAFDPTGAQYIALWPANNKVSYDGPFAYRNDGALIIAPSGTKAVNPQGVALTSRGEVIAAIDNALFTHNGWPMLGDGRVCMSVLDGASYLLTEASEFLTTEAGDRLIVL